MYKYYKCLGIIHYYGTTEQLVSSEVSTKFPKYVAPSLHFVYVLSVYWQIGDLDQCYSEKDMAQKWIKDLKLGMKILVLK